MGLLRHSHLPRVVSANFLQVRFILVNGTTAAFQCQRNVKRSGKLSDHFLLLITGNPYGFFALKNCYFCPPRPLAAVFFRNILKTNEKTFLNEPNLASLFCLFSFFSHDKYSINFTIKDKSVDGVLGTRTRVGRMVGADKSTEL